MNAEDLAFLSIAQLARSIETREVSCSEVVGVQLERIAKVDLQLNSYITVLEEGARAEAARADTEVATGNYRGPLHGVPISLKDLYLTKGVRTTGASRVLAGFVPDSDSAVTERLAAAGCVLLGKANLFEFASGAPRPGDLFGQVHNPWKHGYLTGGSSSGSGAAVAAGLAYMSMGSDTGGSIRIPAALCGTVGLKATYGRVSRYGALVLSWCMDHCGPLTRTVEDAAIVLEAIAGHDRRDPACPDVPVPDYRAALAGGAKGLRVGVPREFFFDDLDEEVEAAVNAAIDTLKGLGAQVREVSLPHAHLTNGTADAIIRPEATAYHLPWMRERLADYGPDMAHRLASGAGLMATDYILAQRGRRALRDEFVTAMSDVDVLVTPTASIPAPPLNAPEVVVRGKKVETRFAMARFTRAFNVTGQPAMALPCGFTREGLPVSLQIVGRAFDEATVLRAGHAYQQATDWHLRRAPIPKS